MCLLCYYYYYFRPRCYVVAMCIILEVCTFFPQDNAPSNTIATGSKITAYMVTVGKVVSKLVKACMLGFQSI